MKRYLLILSLILTFFTPAFAQYEVNDFKGNVTLEKNGTSTPISKKMKLVGKDILNIPEDGFVEILNTASGKLFLSTTHGKFATTTIMMDARAKASDNSAAINGNIRGITGTKKKQKVYNQTGMVTRSLITLDPAVAAMNITSENLCQCLVNAIRTNDFASRPTMPVSLTGETTPEGGMEISMTSVYDYPVYFNILKIKPDGARVEVSELGQPIGNYMLGAKQTISRGQPVPLEEGCRHIVIMTPVPFNLNGLLKDLEEMMGRTTVDVPPADLPVYICELD